MAYFFSNSKCCPYAPISMLNLAKTLTKFCCQKLETLRSTLIWERVFFGEDRIFILSQQFFPKLQNKVHLLSAGFKLSEMYGWYARDMNCLNEPSQLLSWCKSCRTCCWNFFNSGKIEIIYFIENFNL